MSIIKWETVYAKIASRHRTSAGYVKMIHRGERATNSKKAQQIRADLDKWDRKAAELEVA